MPLALAHLLDDARFRESLTAVHLPAFLQRQRWYTSKGRPLDRVSVEALPSDRADLGLWLARVRFADGDEELRVLALAEVGRERAFAPDDARVVARTDAGTLVDAAAEEAFRAWLYGLMSRRRELRGAGGVLRGEAGPLLRAHADYTASRLPPQNSSNTVIAYEPDGFCKLFRKTEAGVHPDRELLGYLSAERGFASVPAFGGAVDYVPDGAGAEPVTLALMLGRVDHEGETWETTLRDVAAFAKTYREAPDSRRAAWRVDGDLHAPLAAGDLPADLRAALGEAALTRIRLLGERTGAMHAHFAAATAEGLRPEPLGPAYWDEARAALLRRLGEEVAYAGDDELRAALTRLVDRLGAVELPRLPAGRTRVHGDYHLGQVLDLGGELAIIDFEGEPLHSLAYRRRTHPPAKDVAGMLRSLHYAPYAHALQETDGAAWAMAAAEIWHAVAARLFLTAYRGAVAGQAFVPGTEEAWRRLLGFFLVDKALYELAYERASRPAWLEIPRAGVLSVAAGM